MIVRYRGPVIRGNIARYIYTWYDIDGAHEWCVDIDARTGHVVAYVSGDVIAPPPRAQRAFARHARLRWRARRRCL